MSDQYGKNVSTSIGLPERPNQHGEVTMPQSSKVITEINKKIDALGLSNACVLGDSLRARLSFISHDIVFPSDDAIDVAYDGYFDDAKFSELGDRKRGRFLDELSEKLSPPKEEQTTLFFFAYEDVPVGKIQTIADRMLVENSNISIIRIRKNREDLIPGYYFVKTASGTEMKSYIARAYSIAGFLPPVAFGDYSDFTSETIEEELSLNEIVQRSCEYVLENPDATDLTKKFAAGVLVDCDRRRRKLMEDIDASHSVENNEYADSMSDTAREFFSHPIFSRASARKIAYDWHTGQDSALYSFASTGVISSEQRKSELINEVEFSIRCARSEFEGKDHQNSEWTITEVDKPANEAKRISAIYLYALLAYVMKSPIESTERHVSDIPKYVYNTTSVSFMGSKDEIGDEDDGDPDDFSEGDELNSKSDFSNISIDGRNIVNQSEIVSLLSDQGASELGENYSEIWFAEGKNMGWQKRTGKAIIDLSSKSPTEAYEQILAKLGVNGEYDLRFSKHEKSGIVVVRSSHDEQTGAEIHLRPIHRITKSPLSKEDILQFGLVSDDE